MEDAPASQPPAQVIEAPAAVTEPTTDIPMPDAAEEAETAAAAKAHQVTADDLQEVSTLPRCPASIICNLCRLEDSCAGLQELPGACRSLQEACYLVAAQQSMPYLFCWIHEFPCCVLRMW